jgi:hypothetical protein
VYRPVDHDKKAEGNLKLVIPGGGIHWWVRTDDPSASVVSERIFPGCFFGRDSAICTWNIYIRAWSDEGTTRPIAGITALAHYSHVK